MDTLFGEGKKVVFAGHKIEIFFRSYILRSTISSKKIAQWRRRFWSEYWKRILRKTHTWTLTHHKFLPVRKIPDLGAISLCVWVCVRWEVGWIKRDHLQRILPQGFTRWLFPSYFPVSNIAFISQLLVSFVISTPRNEFRLQYGDPKK